jgi:hypothetical protein
MRLLVLLAVVVSGAAQAAKVTVPVDVGIGPAAYLITGPVFDDQPVHFGLKISVQAVIDRDWIRMNPRAIPKKYKKQASQITELRISPSIFIPDALIISPKLRNTGLYGITWRPLGLNLPLLKGPVSLRLGAGLLATYAFLHSDVLPTTHFVRPGLDLMAEVELALSRSFLISFGWSSGFYVPQTLGTLGMGALDQSMWHLGQGFLKLHFRFPYTANL